MIPFDPVDLWMWGSGDATTSTDVTDAHVDIGGIRLGVGHGQAQIGDM